MPQLHKTRLDRLKIYLRLKIKRIEVFNSWQRPSTFDKNLQNCKVANIFLSINGYNNVFSKEDI